MNETTYTKSEAGVFDTLVTDSLTCAQIICSNVHKYQVINYKIKESNNHDDDFNNKRINVETNLENDIQANQSRFFNLSIDNIHSRDANADDRFNLMRFSLPFAYKVVDYVKAHDELTFTMSVDYAPQNLSEKKTNFYFWGIPFFDKKKKILLCGGSVSGKGLLPLIRARIAYNNDNFLYDYISFEHYLIGTLGFLSSGSDSHVGSFLSHVLGRGSFFSPSIPMMNILRSTLDASSFIQEATFFEGKVANTSLGRVLPIDYLYSLIWFDSEDPQLSGYVNNEGMIPPYSTAFHSPRSNGSFNRIMKYGNIAMWVSCFYMCTHKHHGHLTYSSANSYLFKVNFSAMSTRNRLNGAKLFELRESRYMNSTGDWLVESKGRSEVNRGGGLGEFSFYRGDGDGLSFSRSTRLWYSVHLYNKNGKASVKVLAPFWASHNYFNTHDVVCRGLSVRGILERSYRFDLLGNKLDLADPSIRKPWDKHLGMKSEEFMDEQKIHLARNELFTHSFGNLLFHASKYVSAVQHLSSSRFVNKLSCLAILELTVKGIDYQYISENGPTTSSIGESDRRKANMKAFSDIPETKKLLEHIANDTVIRCSSFTQAYKLVADYFDRLSRNAPADSNPPVLWYKCDKKEFSLPLSVEHIITMFS